MRVVLLILALLLPMTAQADDRLVRVHAPPALIDSGLLKYALPRFSLKNQVRVEYVEDPAAAQLAFGAEGRPLFSGLGQTWAMEVLDGAHPGTAKLVDWLTSEVGKNTIFGFGDGETFGPPAAQEVAVAAIEYTGDAVEGQGVSLIKCGRCHVTERGRGLSGIGSTPSFFVLRSLEDWENRFTAFYVLNPHPAFTQVTEVTPPFPEDRPSPIAPIELTLDEIESILAYVAALDGADLGAPLQHQ